MADDTPTNSATTTPTKRPPLSYDVREIQVGHNVTVHGNVIELSPIKDSTKRGNCKYFNGKLTDGMKTARFVSFEPSLRPAIERFKNENMTVAISSCQIQENEYDKNLEIKATKQSRVQPSPKRFKLDSTEEASDSKFITTDDLPSIAINQAISIIGKIVHVDPPMEINSKKGKKLTKQDCILKDEKSSCRIVLWEENVGKLSKGASIKLLNVIVKQYDGVRYLSLLQGNSKLEQSPDLDISDGSDEELQNPQPAIGSITGEIIAVQSISNYLSCVSCSGGTVQTLTSTIGKCSKCDAIIKLSRCNQSNSARIVVSDQNNLNYYFTIYSDQLKVLLDDEQDCTQENLLMTHIHTFNYYTKTNIVKEVQKPQ